MTDGMVLKGPNTIGREKSCDVYIDNKILSRYHAVIEVDKNSCLIYDTGSQNKTWKGNLLLKPNIRYNLVDKESITLANVKAYITIEETQQRNDETGSETGSESMVPLDNDILNDEEDENDTGKDNVCNDSISDQKLLNAETVPFCNVIESDNDDTTDDEKSMNAPTRCYDNDGNLIDKNVNETENAKSQCEKVNLSDDITNDEQLRNAPTQKYNHLPTLGDDEKLMNAPTQCFDSEENLSDRNVNETLENEKPQCEKADLSDDSTDNEQLKNAPTQKYNHLPTLEGDEKLMNAPTQCYDSEGNVMDKNVNETLQNAKPQCQKADIINDSTDDEQLKNAPTQKYSHLPTLEGNEKLMNAPTQCYDSEKNVMDRNVNETLQNAKPQCQKADLINDSTDDEQLKNAPTQKYNHLPTLEDDEKLMNAPTQHYDSEGNLMDKNVNETLQNAKSQCQKADLSDDDSTDDEQLKNAPTQKYSHLPTLEGGEKLMIAPTQHYDSEGNLMDKNVNETLQNAKSQCQKANLSDDDSTDDEQLKNAPTQKYSHLPTLENDEKLMNAPTQCYDSEGNLMDKNVNETLQNAKSQCQKANLSNDDSTDDEQLKNAPTQKYSHFPTSEDDEKLMNAPTQCYADCIRTSDINEKANSRPSNKRNILAVETQACSQYTDITSDGDENLLNAETQAYLSNFMNEVSDTGESKNTDDEQETRKSSKIKHNKSELDSVSELISSKISVSLNDTEFTTIANEGIDNLAKPENVKSSLSCSVTKPILSHQESKLLMEENVADVSDNEILCVFSQTQDHGNQTYEDENEDNYKFDYVAETLDVDINEERFKFNKPTTPPNKSPFSDCVAETPPHLLVENLNQSTNEISSEKLQSLNKSSERGTEISKCLEYPDGNKENITMNSDKESHERKSLLVSTRCENTFNVTAEINEQQVSLSELKNQSLAASNKNDKTNFDNAVGESSKIMEPSDVEKLSNRTEIKLDVCAGELKIINKSKNVAIRKSKNISEDNINDKSRVNILDEKPSDDKNHNKIYKKSNSRNIFTSEVINSDENDFKQTDSTKNITQKQILQVKETSNEGSHNVDEKSPEKEILTSEDEIFNKKVINKTKSGKRINRKQISKEIRNNKNSKKIVTSKQSTRKISPVKELLGDEPKTNLNKRVTRRQVFASEEMIKKNDEIETNVENMGQNEKQNLKIDDKSSNTDGTSKERFDNDTDFVLNERATRRQVLASKEVSKNDSETEADAMKKQLNNKQKLSLNKETADEGTDEIIKEVFDNNVKEAKINISNKRTRKREAEISKNDSDIETNVIKKQPNTKQNLIINEAISNKDIDETLMSGFDSEVNEAKINISSKRTTRRQFLEPKEMTYNNNETVINFTKKNSKKKQKLPPYEETSNNKDTNEVETNKRSNRRQILSNRRQILSSEVKTSNDKSIMETKNKRSGAKSKNKEKIIPNTRKRKLNAKSTDDRSEVVSESECSETETENSKTKQKELINVTSTEMKVENLKIKVSKNEAQSPSKRINPIIISVQNKESRPKRYLISNRVNEDSIINPVVKSPKSTENKNNVINEEETSESNNFSISETDSSANCRKQSRTTNRNQKKENNSEFEMSHLTKKSRKKIDLVANRLLNKKLADETNQVLQSDILSVNAETHNNNTKTRDEVQETKTENYLQTCSSGEKNSSDKILEESVQNDDNSAIIPEEEMSSKRRRKCVKSATVSQVNLQSKRNNKRTGKVKEINDSEVKGELLKSVCLPTEVKDSPTLNSDSSHARSSKSSSPSTPSKTRKKAKRNSMSSNEDFCQKPFTPGRGKIKKMVNYRIMFTGMSDDEGHKIVTKLGGDIVDDPKLCTHLVTDKFHRTVKMLCCIAKGIPVVITRWLQECKLAKFFIDHSEYLLKDAAAEKQYNFDLKQTLKQAEEKPLFQDWSIHATNNVKPLPEQMKDIVQFGGGKYLARIPSRFANNTIIVSCPEDAKICKHAAKYGIPVVGAEFLLTGFLRYEINIKAYQLSV